MCSPQCPHAVVGRRASRGRLGSSARVLAFRAASVWPLRRDATRPAGDSESDTAARSPADSGPPSRPACGHCGEHTQPPATARGHVRSHLVTSGHVRSRPVTSGHVRSRPVTSNRVRSRPCRVPVASRRTPSPWRRGSTTPSAASAAPAPSTATSPPVRLCIPAKLCGHLATG